MKSLRIVIATLALAFALGGIAEARAVGHSGGGHGSGHFAGRLGGMHAARGHLGHGTHVAHAHFAGHRFGALRSNRGGLRRGLARAAYVHRLNAARHAAHTKGATRLASREEHRERTATNAKEEQHEKNAKEEHHEKAAKEEHHENGDEDRGGEGD
jgi:hypothetical protein